MTNRGELAAIRQRAVPALVWSAWRSVLIGAATPLLTLVLARWLSPADFGLVGAATVLIALANLLQSVGLPHALIRQPEAELKRAASVVFWGSLLLSAGLYVLLWFGAPLAALVYDAPELVWVFRVLGLRLLLQAGATVPLALMQREFGFRRLAGAQLVAALAPLLVAAPLAYLGWGHRALVLGLLAGSVANLLALWRRTTWRPAWGFDLGLARQLLPFGLLVTLEALQLWVLVQADSGVIGVVQGLDYLGLYATGFSLAFLLVGYVLEPVLPIAYSTFSQLQHDLLAIRGVYVKMSRLVITVTMPLGMGLALIARPLVGLLFSPRWQPMAFVLEVFGLYAAFGHLWSLNPEVFKALNRPGLMPRIYGWMLLYVIPIYLVAAPLGLTAFTLARGSVLLLAAPLQMWAVSRILKLNLSDWLAVVRTPFLASAGMAAGVGLLRLWPVLSFPAGQALQLAVWVGGGAGLYLALLWWLDRAVVRDLWQLSRQALAGVRQ